MGEYGQEKPESGANFTCMINIIYRISGHVNYDNDIHLFMNIIMISNMYDEYFFI